MAGFVVRSDAGIVAGIVRGDDGAAETLFRRFFRPLVGWVTVRCHDAVLAEDVAQEALVRFIGAAGTFDVERAVWPYLTTVAKHVLVDQLRRQREEIGLDGFAAVLGDVEPDAGAEVVSALWLDEVLAGLPDRQQVAVDLRYRRGWANDDAAAFLGLSNTAFRQLLFRARQNLKSSLDAMSEGLRGVVIGFTGLRWRARAYGRRLRGWLGTEGMVMSAGVEGVASILLAASVVLVSSQASVFHASAAVGIAAPWVVAVEPRTQAITPDGRSSSTTSAAPSESSPAEARPPGSGGASGGSTARVDTAAGPADAWSEVTVADEPDKFIISSYHEVVVTWDNPITEEDLPVSCEGDVAESVCDAATKDEVWARGGGPLITIHCDGMLLTTGDLLCSADD